MSLAPRLAAVPTSASIPSEVSRPEADLPAATPSSALIEARQQLAAERATVLAKHQAEFAARAEQNRERLRSLTQAVLPPLCGLGLLLAVWSWLAVLRPDLPGPIATWQAALELFANPFYDNGPNDQGIGWNILHSLARVGIGFGLAAAIGIPLGFLIGRFAFISGMLAPVISLLRPVSPLAWLPIGLLVFQKAHPASIWVIFISSIWPILINTAHGVRSVPQDYLNVARVLNLSEWKVFSRILFPAVLPYLMTGIRLSIGVAWLVIVAAEMLTGGSGLGFWVWDEWNNLNVAHILIAIVMVGVIGFALEQSLMLIARRFDYS